MFKTSIYIYAEVKPMPTWSNGTTSFVKCKGKSQLLSSSSSNNKREGRVLRGKGKTPVVFPYDQMCVRVCSKICRPQLIIY